MCSSIDYEKTADNNGYHCHGNDGDANMFRPMSHRIKIENPAHKQCID